MKKTVLIFAMVSLLVLSAFGASAANYYPTQDAAENYSYTVSCELGAIADDAAAIVNGESMYGLVAVLGTGEDADITTATSYVYLDQATVDADGVVTFAGFLPMGVNPDDESFEECTLFIGGPGFDTAKELGVLKKAGGAMLVTCKVKDSSVRKGGAIINVYDSTGAAVVELTSEISAGEIAVEVPVGTDYSFEFTKTNYCKYTLTGVDVAGELTLPEVDLTVMAGNADGVGSINAYDLSPILENFGADAECDVTGDGAINAYDMSAVLDNFGQDNVTVAYTAQ